MNPAGRRRRRTGNHTEIIEVIVLFQCATDFDDLIRVQGGIRLLVQGDADSQGFPLTNGLSCLCNRFAQEPQSIFEAAAKLVYTPVRYRV